MILFFIFYGLFDEINCFFTGCLMQSVFFFFFFFFFKGCLMKSVVFYGLFDEILSLFLRAV